MKTKPINKKITIIAGPCSINKGNIEDVYKIANIYVTNHLGKKQKAIAGTRIVGLKSRTSLSVNSDEMGIDFPVFMSNLNHLMEGASFTDIQILPSVKIAMDVIRQTNLLVATEIMSPLLQLPLFERYLPKGKLLIWNPSVNQLGWPVMKMGIYAKRNNWFIGLKNGKWLGEENKGETSMEKTWSGLAKYANYDQSEASEKLILIHRGVDIKGKGLYRNALVHKIAKRVKIRTKARLFFDPSHSFGPKLRKKIVEGTIEAMQMKIDESNYLYDGILIEVGKSMTDTEQHVSVQELTEMCYRIAGFRDLVEPDELGINKSLFEKQKLETSYLTESIYQSH